MPKKRNNHPQKPEGMIPDSEAQYRSLFESNPHPMWVCDMETLSFLAVNDAVVNHYGYSREEFLSMTIKDIRPPEDIPLLLDTISKLGKGFQSCGRWRHRKKDGTIIDVEITSHELTFSGRNTRLVLAKDITEQKRVEEAQKSTISLLQATLESTADGLLVVDLTGKIVSFNQQFARMWRIPEEVLSSRDDDQALAWVLEQLKYPDQFLQKVKDLYRQPEAESYDTLAFKDGRIFERFSQPQRIDGQPVGRVWSFRDVTEYRRAEKMIQHLAYYDVLTGLPNRTFLHDSLQQNISTASAEKRSLALLVIDLNRFKEINNTLGHLNGDRLLKNVAARLRDALPEAHTIARLGDDEFALILKDADIEGATNAAHMIIRRFEEPFTLENISLDIGISIGIAVFPGHGEDADIVIRRADIAMHIAKKTEGGYAIYSPPYDQYAPGRLAFIGELRQAIEQNHLFLLYQPMIDLKAMQPRGIEALVRWQHPRSGVIQPDQFIELAEYTGLIKPLTLWVLKEALRQSRNWNEQQLETIVAINFSVRSLQNPQLLDQITGLLSTWGLPPNRLRLEITENIIMADPSRAMEILSYLSSIGMKFSIDDFGTGYSSLGYLQRLPVDEIKIDKSFVMNMMVNESSNIIVRSVIELGHNLGLKVVAEGVENKETMERLASLGCDYAQGYFISRPIPAPELKAWLGKH